MHVSGMQDTLGPWVMRFMKFFICMHVLLLFAAKKWSKPDSAPVKPSREMDAPSPLNLIEFPVSGNHEPYSYSV